MKIVNLKQGTTEWKEGRLHSRNASEASVIMGCHPNIKRTELLKYKALGLEQEFDPYTLDVIFPEGHRVEEVERSVEEDLLHIDLYPLCGTDGYLSASYDGISMDFDTVLEVKQWNKDKADYIRDTVTIPDCDYWQCVQQAIVSGCKTHIYILSDGESRKAKVITNGFPEEDKVRLLEAWKLFDIDVNQYKHEEAPAKAVGASVDMMPSLNIKVTGMVTHSNLGAFKDHALKVLDNLKKDLETDQDFADAEKVVKWAEKVEKDLDLAKKQALSETDSIKELFETLDLVKASVREHRLSYQKDIKAKKESIRADEIEKHVVELKDFVSDLANKIADYATLPYPESNFPAAIKGVRTIESLREKLNVEMTRCKLDATESFNRISSCIETFKSLVSKDYLHLFVDQRNLLAHSDPSTIGLVIKDRIDSYEEAQEEKRKAEKERAEKEAIEAAERHREAIRIEEEAKAKAKADSEARLAEEARLLEEARLAEEARLLEEARLAEEVREENPAPGEAICSNQFPEAPTTIPSSNKSSFNKPSKMISITLDEYERLVDAEMFLFALKGAGVDNWSGYEFAQDLYNAEKKRNV